MVDPGPKEQNMQYTNIYFHINLKLIQLLKGLPFMINTSNQQVKR